MQTLFKRHWNTLFSIKNDVLDVMAIYKDRHRFPHRLDNCVQTYGVDVKNTHRALDDIKATFRLNLLRARYITNTAIIFEIIPIN